MQTVRSLLCERLSELSGIIRAVARAGRKNSIYPKLQAVLWCLNRPYYNKAGTCL